MVAVQVGRSLADVVPAAKILKKYLPNHYPHPNSKKKHAPANLFTKPPLYLCEQKNSDMIKIARAEQDDFLFWVAEQVLDKKGFLQDLKIIKSEDFEEQTLKDAEKRVHKEVLDAGEYVGHGDLLTFQQFYVAKRLCQGSVTAVERLEFLRYFRIGLFHMKMSKEPNAH